MNSAPLHTLGLFAGIGGLELGFQRVGAICTALCEWNEYAQAILSDRFPEVRLHGDVQSLRAVPPVIDTLLAGFPCQDLSQAGKTQGISGARSGLVTEVFRLAKSKRVRHVVLENVPFMLRLNQGRAMSVLAGELERLGFRWAYRVLDSRGFGVAQRRRRVFVLASRDYDVARRFFPPDCESSPEPKPRAFGFYWTEGNTGLGWAEDAVPTLKCGSGLGIPSPPAIWVPRRGIFTPTIDDTESLQGFSRGWTSRLEEAGQGRRRWALVGNAVTVPVAEWVAMRLLAPEGDAPHRTPISVGQAWPSAAYGGPGQQPSGVVCSEQPIALRTPLLEKLDPERLLSERATCGFFGRLQRSSLRRPAAFDRDLKLHIDRMAKTRCLQASRV